MRTLALALMLVATAAAAQLRTLPPEAQLAHMSFIEANAVDVDGSRMELSPGAQIRDESNRIILPVALPPASLVCYVVDADGRVHRVWILTPEEAARRG